MFQLSNLPEPIVRQLNGLWRRRWLVVAAAWGAALLGWFGVWLLPDKYESRAQVFVQTETILQPVLRGVTATPDYASRVQVMRLQLLARPNVEEIIYRSGLDKTIEAATNLEHRTKMQSLVNWVASNIEIESPRDMYFIIRYAHGDPEVSRRVTDAVLNLLIEQDIGASLTENQAARRRLDLQIEEFEEKLTANETAVAAFRRDNAIELASAEGAVRRRDLKESELERTLSEMARTRGRIITLRNLLSATPRGATGGELDRLRVELADLRSRYEETHPDVRGVMARIAELERADDGLLSSNPEFVRLQSELRVAQDSIAGLQAREATLRQEIYDLDIAVGQAPAATAELQQIERQYETTKNTYEDLLARRDRLELTENLGPSGRGVEYQVFERPQRALSPTSPPRAQLIFAVVALALIAGAGVGVLFNLLDKTFTQTSELEKAFGLPVLGAFSEADSIENRRERRFDILKLGGAGAALLMIASVYVYLSSNRSDDLEMLEEAGGVDIAGEEAVWAL
ncbi:MAG: XrtA system polysaccharide chain length determinant [Pseudomonadota bacterium]